MERDLADAAHARHVDDRIVGGAHRGQLGGRVGVRQAAADGAAVARLAMADVAQRLDHQRAMFRDLGRGFDIALASHGADAQPLVADHDAAQFVEPVEIDQMIDDHVAKIHHRHERLPAGQHFGVGQFGQQLGGFLELSRRVIIEGRWFHRPGIVSRRARPGGPC